MRKEIASTENTRRIQKALANLEARLKDAEIMGLGLIYGQPGLGKTMTVERYCVQAYRQERVLVAWVRAKGIWTESSMLQDILESLGISARKYRKDIMFRQVIEALMTEPAMILIDEIDSIAESRKLIGLLKDIHDMTSCAIAMIGEERVDGLLRRYHSFYNRLNRDALVYLTGHTADDVTKVIRKRCEVAVSQEVCDEIHRSVGKKSMRSVIDRIREIEAFAATNQIKQFGMGDYQAMLVNKKAGSNTGQQPVQIQGERPTMLGVVNG